MARKRSTTTNETQIKENSMSNLFTPIDDADELASILSGARGRGDYKTVLEEFIGAEIRLAEVPLTMGLFENKKASTVKTGFENAKNGKNPPEGADQVKVIKKEDKVYLVNQAVATA